MRTHRQVAKSERERKEQHPELYCPARRCLWKTAMVHADGKRYILNADPCRRHPSTEASRVEEVKEAN